MERATGIEPALSAWKAEVQPSHSARVGRIVGYAVFCAEKMWLEPTVRGSPAFEAVAVRPALGLLRHRLDVGRPGGT